MSSSAYLTCQAYTSKKTLLTIATQLYSPRASSRLSVVVVLQVAGSGLQYLREDYSSSWKYSGCELVRRHDDLYTQEQVTGKPPKAQSSAFGG